MNRDSFLLWLWPIGILQGAFVAFAYLAVTTGDKDIRMLCSRVGLMSAGAAFMFLCRVIVVTRKRMRQENIDAQTDARL